MINKITPVILIKNEEHWLPYCLESIAGWFNRIVLYDVGSEDKTPEIVQWYTKKEAHRTDFRVRLLPHCEPSIQGTFRNAMIAETQTNWYMILDGDEIYRPQDLKRIQAVESILDLEHKQNKIYGMFRRIEILGNLEKRYDIERTHHRIYHRTAIWNGTHPGEVPVIPQKAHREIDFPEIKCLHMHNTIRSSLDEKVPGRVRRRIQKTYHPGIPISFNLLKEYPILKKPIQDFSVNPVLKGLQNAS